VCHRDQMVCLESLTLMLVGPDHYRMSVEVYRTPKQLAQLGGPTIDILDPVSEVILVSRGGNQLGINAETDSSWWSIICRCLDYFLVVFAI
jgi:hypothetical protein